MLMDGDALVPGDREMPIERERVRQALATHDLEAHRIADRKRLAGVAVNPVSYGFLGEVHIGSDDRVLRRSERAIDEALANGRVAPAEDQ